VFIPGTTQQNVVYRGTFQLVISANPCYRWLAWLSRLSGSFRIQSDLSGRYSRQNSPDRQEQRSLAGNLRLLSDRYPAVQAEPINRSRNATQKMISARNLLLEVTGPPEFHQIIHHPDWKLKRSLGHIQEKKPPSKATGPDYLITSTPPRTGSSGVIGAT